MLTFILFDFSIDQIPSCPVVDLVLIVVHVYEIVFSLNLLKVVPRVPSVARLIRELLGEHILGSVQIGARGREGTLAGVADAAPAHPDEVAASGVRLKELDQIVLVVVILDVGLVEHAVPDALVVGVDVAAGRFAAHLVDGGAAFAHAFLDRDLLYIFFLLVRNLLFFDLRQQTYKCLF